MKAFDVAKYLRKNPPLVLPVKEKFSHAVVIPAYNELDHFAATENSIRQALKLVNEKIAVIAVINYPKGASGRDSEALYNLIRAGVFPGVIPLYLPELSGGVGAARKAGMDSFIATLAPEDMEKSVIFSLDSDTLVEPEYFAELLPAALDGGAVTAGFSHQSGTDADHQAAIDRYEAYLSRYVSMLRRAGSPYAFFTVGSAFAVRADAYLKAGGMKVKEAGEDFYFLQAVAKTTQIRAVPEILVHPSGRISTRVPFGTGPAVAALLRNEELNEIADGAFSVLAEVLKQVSAAALVSPEKFLARLPMSAAEFFFKENFPAVWKKILLNLPDRPGCREKAFHEWFDGLKTLRFLHFLNGFMKKI